MPLVARLLAARGITGEEDAARFFEPQYEHAHDPLLLADMPKAVERIQDAIAQGEQITVYADYDADAITAAAVLLRYFQQVNYKNVDYYIPDRFAEGYGINPEAIRVLIARGTKLIITVDCGINASEAVDLANSLGTEVIITDHHQLTDGIPRAAAVVNPRRPDDKYPFKDLTGVGVAFKLVQGLGAGGWAKWLLDLVAIGTVADCQSLLGENRIFVKWGMLVLKKTRWIGLQTLLEGVGLGGQELDTYKIGFLIAPRLNAAGRIAHGNIALELLLTDDGDRARTLADKLEELNRHRQELTEQILSEAREQLALAKDKKVLLAQGENWPRGIVGLVAGKLTDEFYRPVLVLSRSESEAVGSARSVFGFNIVEAIGQSREILLRYGGHAQAAGFTLTTEHIEVFHRNLLSYADAALPEELLSPVLYYDAEIELSEVSEELLNNLQKFEPHGVGNPRPKFRINNLQARNVKKIGNSEKHLRMYVSDESENQRIGCIGFNLGFWAEKLQEGAVIDMICEPQFNEWNGERNIQLKIVDLCQRN